MKHLEELPGDGVSDLEFGTGEVYCYSIDDKGNIGSKEIRTSNPDKLNV